MPEENQVKWIGIRPTSPEESIPVKQSTPGNLLGIISQYKATPPTLTDLNYHPVLLDVNGRVIISPVTEARNITQIGGTALTGRDISLDLRALTDNTVTGILKTLETYLRVLNPNTITQIKKHAVGIPNDSVELYTIPAGKTFYLSSAAMSNYGGTAGTTAKLVIFDHNYNLIFSIFQIPSSGTTAVHSQNNIFLPPIKITANWSIYVDSEIDGPKSYCAITGWEE